MIKLNSDTFRRAIEKAQSIAPACELLHTDEINFTFRVARAGGGAAIIDIWFEGGTCWTSCDCRAGVGYGRGGWPQPCYHVARAALSIGLLASPAMLPFAAALEPAPERAVARQVPAPLLDPRELAPIPAAPESQSLSQEALIGYLRSAVRALAGRLWFASREARA